MCIWVVAKRERERKIRNHPPTKVPTCAHTHTYGQPIAAGEQHPAAGQYGLFAAANLHPGEHILDYLGYVTTEVSARNVSGVPLR